jgi:hypothetical protein
VHFKDLELKEENRMEVTRGGGREEDSEMLVKGYKNLVRMNQFR